MIRMLSAAGKLFSLAIGILFALSVAANAEVWRMATKQPAGSPEGKAFAKFAELVGEYTKGKIEVKVFPSEQLGKTDAALEQLQAGTVHVYPEGPSYMRKWVSQMEFVGSPFLFKDRPHWVRFMHSPEVQGWLKQVEDKAGIAIIGDITAFVRGPYRCLVSKKPVKGLADLKGLKIRTMKTTAIIDTWNALGAIATPIAWPDVPVSLKQKLIDGGEGTGVSYRSMTFYKDAKYFTRLAYIFSWHNFMMSKKIFDGLTPVQQRAVKDAGKIAEVYERKVFLDQEAALFEELKGKGAEIIVPADRAKWVETISSVYDSNAAKVGGRDRIDMVLNF